MREIFPEVGVGSLVAVQVESLLWRIPVIKREKDPGKHGFLYTAGIPWPRGVGLSEYSWRAVSS